MRYKVGMSDKKTRARSSSGKKTPGSFNISSRNINKRTRSSTTRARSKSFSSTRKSPQRKGLRKFSKLGVIGRGIDNKNKDSKVVRGNKPKGKSKIAIFLKKSMTFLVSFGILSAVIGSIALGLYLKSLEKSLPSPDKLIARTSDQSTILYDRNGKELFKIYGDENRQFVKIEDIPEETRWALLAAEDMEFYQHKGMDWKGIIRCGFITTRGYLQGGSISEGCGASTITQQLVRNTIMYDVFGDEAFERDSFVKTVRRKLREILLSMQVEQNFTKDEILQLYMNEVALGGVNYGFEAAAQSYFGKSVTELDLAESAMLAGIIQSPSIHSPLYGINPEGAPARQEYVLAQLEEDQDLTGISLEEINAAREEELVYSSGNIDIEAYHFVFYIKQLLEEKYGPEVVERGGLRVTTTIDMSTQRIAEEELRKGVAEYGNPLGVYNGAMVVLDPNTNQILAMVGSIDPNSTDDPRIDGNVNVTTSLRQMGSSFKPYVYLTAFEKYGPWFQAPDIPMNFGNYKPLNWDEKYYGFMTAREALLKSRNIPANYTLQLVGIDALLRTTEKVGITTLTDRNNYGLSLALGAAEMKLLEHAQGFSVFATGGIKRDVAGILKVEDSKGEVLEEYEETKGERVFDEKDVYMLNWVLCDLGGFGDQPMAYHYAINGQRVVCGKTGTTNGPKDLISMQYHKNIVVAVWTGNNNGEEVPGAWSTTVPLPIAHNFIERVIGKYPSELPSRPSGILAATVCNDTGLLATKDSNCKKVSTIYVQGRAPKKDEREKVYVCKENGLLASNLDAARQFKDGEDKYTLLDVKYVLNAELLNSDQQTSFENFLKDKTSFLAEKPEEDVCPLPLGPGGEPVVTIDTPTSGQELTTGDLLQITATAWAADEVDFVEFYFNGSMIGKQEEAPYQYTYTIPSSLPTGSYTVLAKVVDTDGMMGTESVIITVTNPNPVTITFNTPTTGTLLSPNVNEVINASITNVDPSDSVNVTISGPGGYSWSSSLSYFAGNWTTSWFDFGLAVGPYTLKINAGGVEGVVTVNIE